MEDRLDIALEMAIKLSNDPKVKEILSSVRSLGDEIGYMDWTDFAKMKEDGTLEEMVRTYFIN